MSTRQSIGPELGRLPRRLLLWLVVAGLTICSAVVIARSSSTRLSATTTSIKLPPGAGIEPRLGEQVPLGLRFRDERGQQVQLGDFIRDKPVILSLVYYECPMLCNLVMDGLVRSLQSLDLDVAEEFVVLTVSFDPREGPQLAAASKQTAIRRYSRSGASDGWHFLTGGEPAIRQLIESVGFRVAFDEKTGRFAHGAGLFVLTPEGKVSRFLNGVEFPPRDLRLAVTESSERRIGSLGDQVLLLCYQYDPARGRYGLAIVSVIRFAGIITVLIMAAAFAVLIRRERAKEKDEH